MTGFVGCILGSSIATLAGAAPPSGDPPYNTPSVGGTIPCLCTGAAYGSPEIRAYRDCPSTTLCSCTPDYVDGVLVGMIANCVAMN